MSQVPVTEMKSPGSLQRVSQNKICQGINAYLKSIFITLPALKPLVVPAHVSCVLYLCALLPILSLLGAPLSWLLLG